MFKIYFTQIKAMFRSRDAIIWMLAFPIILSTLFYVAFGTLDDSYKLSPITVAVVEGDYEKEFTTALDSVSSGNDRLFNIIKIETEDAALKLLKGGECKGYIYPNKTAPAAKVISEGLDQTILKEFLDSYTLTKNSITRIIENDPSNMLKIASLIKNEDFTRSIPVSENEQTEIITYYYALLAMTCMYGGNYGLSIIESLQANLSPLGARRCVAPINHMKIFFAELAAAVTVHCFNLSAALFYMTKVLGLNFGDKMPAVVLTCYLGAVVGIMFGAFISALTKFKSVVKSAIITTGTMICCFFAGLMISGIDYLIARDYPVLSWINPAARISNALYCLYYYDNYNKYFLNIIILSVMAIVLFISSIIAVRRQRYESI